MTTTPTVCHALTPGYCNVAAFFDAQPEERGGNNAGNLYSKKESILHVNTDGEGETEVFLNSEIQERKFNGYITELCSSRPLDRSAGSFQRIHQ
jgi:hypothetical protein